MPSLKDKYSDAELDRSNKAFDEIINRPDIKALDDQGDAIARDLGTAEQSAPSKAVKDTDPETIQDAEQNPDDNPFGYQEGAPKEPRSRRFSGWSRQKKSVVGGAAGFAIAGILLATIMVLPAKFISITHMIAKEAGQRVEQATEKRAGMIVSRAIFNQFGRGSGYIANGGIFSSLVTGMRVNNFEKRLAERGLTVERDGKNVKLIYKGEALEGGRGFKNEAEVEKALRSNKLTNKMLKDVIKEDIPSWRWMKRAKYAKWLRYKYGIPRYGIVNSKEADSDKAVADMDKERRTAEFDLASQNAGELLDCVMSAGDDCVDLDDKTTARPLDKASGSTEDIKKALDDAGREAIEESSSKPNSSMSQLITEKLSAKFAVGSIPVIGQAIAMIDLASIINHAFNKELETGFLGTAVATMKEKNYAQLYGTWEGYTSQMQLGALRSDYGARLDAQMTDSKGRGVETAQAFNALSGKYSKASDIPGVPVDKIGTNQPSVIKEKYEAFNERLGGAASFLRQPGNLFLETWYGTVGQAISAVFEQIGKFLGWLLGIFTPDELSQKVTEMITKFVNYIWKHVLEFFDLDYNPFVEGPQFFNNAHGGATASYNRFCKESGCRKLTPAQTGAQNSTIAAERAQYRADKGILYALFSPEETTSLTTQASVQMPTDPAAAFAKLGNIVANAPGKLLSTVIAPQSSATTQYVDLYGVDPYGATDKDLNQPLSQEFIDGEPCPKVAEGEYNSCVLDTAVAEAMLCEFDPESTDCADTDPATDAESTIGDFRIASYNFLGDNHTSGSVDDSKRFDRALRVIESNKIDIVGLQEFQAPQFDRLKERTTRYDIFPDTKIYGTDATSANSIIWDNTKFKLLDSGTRPFKYFGGTNNQMPWVLLGNHEGTQSFYVFNVHDPARPENADLRYQNALAHAEMVKEFSAKGKEMFFTGDFNSGYYLRSSNNITFENKRENLTYCILTRDSIMQNAFDNWLGKPPGTACPTTKAESPTPCKNGRSSNNENSVDHIYVSKSVRVSCYWTIDKGIFNNGSDVHDTIIADIAGPETSNNAGSEFRISTYNLPKRVGVANYKKAVENMKGRNFDVVGMQELAGENYRYIQREMQQGGEYSIYPDKKQNEPIIRHGSNSQSILWKNEKFELVKASIFRYPRYPEDSAGKSGDEVIEQGMANAPIVWLRDKKTGQIVVFINIHNAAYARNDKRRYDAAHIFIEQVQKIKQEDPSIPVFLTGDFNEGTGVRYPPKNATYERKYSNLLYCMFAENNLMVSTEALSKGQPTKCPNDSIGGVDYIYGSKGVDAKSSGRIEDSTSDHPILFVDIVVPGDKKGGWVWPIKKGLKPGPCWNKLVNGKRHAGMDINTDDPNNEVVAMHSATITETGYEADGAGNYIKFKATNGMYYIYEHLKSIRKHSGQVEAGEVVGIAGKTGNLIGVSSAAHFHVVVSKLNDFPSYGSLGGSIDPRTVLPKPAPEGYTCTTN